MPFEAKTVNNHRVIYVDEPRLDASLAETFKTYLFEQIDDGATSLVVDLTEVRFMDSSGLGSLVAALKKLGGSEGVILAGALPAVKDLFELTSMDKLFKIVTTVNAATGA